MKKKLLWAVVALLGIAVAVLIAAWPRYLPVETMQRKRVEPLINHLKQFRVFLLFKEANAG